MENYTFNKNDSGSSKSKSSWTSKSKKSPFSSGSTAKSSSGMDSRWWLWYLKNQMQGGNEVNYK